MEQQLNAADLMTLLAEELEALEGKEPLWCAEDMDGLCSMQIKPIADLAGLDFKAGIIARDRYLEGSLHLSRIVSVMADAANKATAHFSEEQPRELSTIATMLGLARVLGASLQTEGKLVARAAQETVERLATLEEGDERAVTHTARCVLRFARDLVFYMGGLEEAVDLHTRAFVRSLWHTLGCAGLPDPVKRVAIVAFTEQLAGLQEVADAAQ